MSPRKADGERLHLPRLDAQSLVTLVVAVIGVVGWMTKVAIDLGEIRGALETRVSENTRRVDKAETQIVDHDRRIGDHERRIGSLER